MTKPAPGRGRIIALRVVAAVLALIPLIGMNVTLILPWIAWMPDKTLLSIGMSTEDVPRFLVQGTAIQLYYTILAVSVALQLRRPARNVSALWIVTLILGSMIVLDIVHRDVGDPLWYLMYGLFLAIVVLHPRRLAPLWPVDPVAATVAAIGAVPLAWFAVAQLRQQFAPAHQPDNFYFGMALAATLTLLGAAIGSTALPGRWIGVAVATAMAVLVGVSSIAHPPAKSALPTAWAWAAIAWGIAVLVVNRRHLFGRPTEVARVQARAEVSQDARG
jgi:hypothetical protein